MLDRLEQLAKDASCGAWYSADGTGLLVSGGAVDSEFVAAATPARVLALIEAARALEALVSFKVERRGGGLVNGGLLETGVQEPHESVWMVVHMEAHGDAVDALAALREMDA